MKGGTTWIALTVGALMIVFAGWLLLPQRGSAWISDSVPNAEPEASEKPDYGQEILEWRLLAWRDANGNIPPGILQQALQDREEYLHSGLDQDGFGDVPTSHLRWVTQGPDNVGGRTRSVIVHPTNSNILWAAAITGGVWKSFDRAESWVPMNGQLGNFTVGCLTLDTNPPPPNEPPYQTLYAGTGEGGHGGDGIYKSTDAGATWGLLSGTAVPPGVSCPDSPWCTVSRISVKPGESNIVLASNNTGIWRSTDGGETWGEQPVVPGQPRRGSRFVSFDPNDGRYAVGEVIEFVDDEWVLRAKYSTDGGATWGTAMRGNTAFQPANGHRIEFGYKPNESIFTP